ncbi:class I SAM-dependent methyltransferase [Candidatus Riflebacteria bacterium]
MLFPSRQAPEDRKNQYDFYSPVYNIIFKPFFNFGRRTSISRMNIKPGHIVLELGCGTGASFKHFTPFFRTYKQAGTYLVGMDLSFGMLKQAKNLVESKDINFTGLTCCDGRILPFQDGTFNSVFAAYTFSVIPNPGVALKEILRVCKPGAKIVFLNHLKSRNKIISRIEEMVDPLVQNFGWQTKDDLREVIKSNDICDFTEETLKTNPIFKIVCFRKPSR